MTGYNQTSAHVNRLQLSTESDTLDLGRRLAEALRSGMTMYLYGDLGAGKTTLTRGLLRALGYEGAVKSPTFTLVEPYEFSSLTLFHFDLYRIAHPDELDYLGLSDYFHSKSVCVVEWPEKGEAVLPRPDISVKLNYQDVGRVCYLAGHTPLGYEVVQTIQR